jgi:hypothetical protein
VPRARGARAHWSRWKRDDGNAWPQAREKVKGASPIAWASDSCIFDATSKESDVWVGDPDRPLCLRSTMALRPAGQLKVRQDQWRKWLVDAKVRSGVPGCQRPADGANGVAAVSDCAIW